MKKYECRLEVYFVATCKKPSDPLHLVGSYLHWRNPTNLLTEVFKKLVRPRVPSEPKMGQPGRNEAITRSVEYPFPRLRPPPLYIRA